MIAFISRQTQRGKKGVGDDDELVVWVVALSDARFSLFFFFLFLEGGLFAWAGMSA